MVLVIVVKCFRKKKKSFKKRKQEVRPSFSFNFSARKEKKSTNKSDTKIPRNGYCARQSPL